MQSDIDLMVSNGNVMKQSYQSIEKEVLADSAISNSDPINQINNSLNNTLGPLNLLQNTYGSLNNIYQENLIKHEQLIKMQNNDLTKQLKNLEMIESNIENKNRMIEQINYNMEKEQNSINILIISIVFTIILLSIFIMYGYNIISKNIFYYCLIIFGLLYLCLFLYSNNIFYLKSSINSLLNGDIEKRLSNSLNNWANTEVNNLENDLYGIKQNWINNNCSCPLQENEEENNNNIYPTDENIEVPQVNGYYYYDGSTPKQLLIPTPSVRNLNQNIEWVDYSQNSSQNRYNISHNQESLLYDVINNLGSVIPNSPTFNLKNPTNYNSITYSANF